MGACLWGGSDPWTPQDGIRLPCVGAPGRAAQAQTLLGTILSLSDPAGPGGLLGLTEGILELDGRIESAQAALRVSADGYNPLDQAASWYPWDYIAEPHKTTHLAVVDCSSDAVYSWAVTHHAAGYPTPVRTLSDSTGCEVKLVMTAVSTMHKVAIDLARGQRPREPPHPLDVVPAHGAPPSAMIGGRAG